MNRHVWQRGTERYHHLIDPATGRPVLGRIVSATALAPDLATAEVATKALLVSGGRGMSLNPADASGAVVIDITGTLLAVPGRFPMRLRSTRSIPTAAPPEPAGVYPVGLLAAVSLLMLVTASVANLLGWELSPLTWYLARASGVTLYLLLWASTMLGLGLSTRFLDSMMRRGDVFSLHAYLTALALSFLGVHVLTLAADQYTAFTLADLLIPFHSGVREPWTGLGVIAGWLLVAISAQFPVAQTDRIPVLAEGALADHAADADRVHARHWLGHRLRNYPNGASLRDNRRALRLPLPLSSLSGRREPLALMPKTAPPLDRMTARM